MNAVVQTGLGIEDDENDEIIEHFCENYLSKYKDIVLAAIQQIPTAIDPAQTFKLI